MKREPGARASDHAYSVLRREILEFSLEPGEVIAEVETAARLGVSRTPLREAIARLLADGLLTPEGVRGVAVAPLTGDDVRALADLREALEVQAARIAALRGAAAPFAELVEAFEQLGTELTRDLAAPHSAEGLTAHAAAHPVVAPSGLLVDRTAARTADRIAERVPAGSTTDDGNTARARTYELAAVLDSAIESAAQSPMLAVALAQVRVRLARVRRLAHDDLARLASAAAEHRAIAEAISWGDPELAVHAVRVHLRRSLTHALARLGDSGTEAGTEADTTPQHHRRESA